MKQYDYTTGGGKSGVTFHIRNFPGVGARHSKPSDLDGQHREVGATLWTWKVD